MIKAKFMSVSLGSGLILLVCALALIGRNLIAPAASATSPSGVFDEVWRSVDQRYFDRSFNGYDWRAVGRSYKAKIPARHADMVQAADVITEMLSLLEVSHLQFVPAWQVKAQDAHHSRFGLILPELKTVAGLTISFANATKLPMVTALDPHSFLAQHGVAVGSRLIITLENAKDGRVHLTYGIIARDGVSTHLSQVLDAPRCKTKLGARPFEGGPISVTCVSDESFEALARLRASANDPQALVRYPSLGVTTTLGRAGSLPKIIDVAKGSIAEQAAIEPGSTLKGIESAVSADGTQKINIAVILPSGQNIEIKAPVDKSSATTDWATRREMAVVDGIAVIKFGEFNTDTVQWLAVEQRRYKGRAIVLDLRYNAGGTKEAMLALLARFLPAETLVGYRHTAEGATALRVPQGYRPLSTRLWVLVGPATASAAEITAQALRKYAGARVIGQRTAGEVVEAKSFPLTDGSLLQIPVASFSDSDGHAIEGGGVSPDVETWSTLDDIRRGVDKSLTTAIVEAQNNSKVTSIAPATSAK